MIIYLCLIFPPVKELLIHTHTCHNTRSLTKSTKHGILHPCLPSQHQLCQTIINLNIAFCISEQGLIDFKSLPNAIINTPLLYYYLYVQFEEGNGAIQGEGGSLYSKLDNCIFPYLNQVVLQSVNFSTP